MERILFGSDNILLFDCECDHVTARGSESNSIKPRLTASRNSASTQLKQPLFNHLFFVIEKKNTKQEVSATKYSIFKVLHTERTYLKDLMC